MTNKDKEKVKKVLQDAQTAPDDEIIEEPKEEEEDPANQPPVTPPVTPPADQPPATPPTTPPTPPVTPPAQKPEDRLIESQKEAYILAQKNKKLSDAIEQASHLPDPTDEELRREYPDWEKLTPFEQKLAKDSLVSTRRFALIEEQHLEGKKIDEWADKVETFIATDAGKQIPDGQQDRFRSFCLKPTRRGLDFDDLTAAFLYTAEVSTPRTQHKGSLFSQGGGGAGVNTNPDKPKELTVEDIQLIRATDPKRYKKLVKEGKVNLV